MSSHHCLPRYAAELQVIHLPSWSFRGRASPPFPRSYNDVGPMRSPLLQKCVHTEAVLKVMSTSWNEANKQQVNPHVSTNLGSSQGDPNAPVNYIEFFPEAGDADFASLFPELMGMPIDSNNSLPASTSRQSLTMPENSTLPLQIGGASGNGRHDGTAGQPFSSFIADDSLPHGLQTTPLNTAFDTLRHEAVEGIQGLRSLVEDQVKQIYVLQMQIHSYHRRSRSLSTPWLHSFAFVKINCQALALEENKRNVTLSGHFQPKP
ncbi:hypothetical protein BKA70DRAFT_1436189 [Coprinopsis sp. MPI-PUGE-AT-0042]|nr:hypothetical protein BKA70DRAFT_1436189 [Coprinopsis sp. MPI-PUGE-AT-0042]